MHRNRTAYYTESAVHLDLEDVAFVDGTLTLYGPSAVVALQDPRLRQVRTRTQAAPESVYTSHWRSSCFLSSIRSSHSSPSPTPPSLPPPLPPPISQAMLRTGGGGAAPESGRSTTTATALTLPCYSSVDLEKKLGKKKCTEGRARGAGPCAALCPPIALVEQPLKRAECASYSERTLFVLSPHFSGNFFHLMNDNLLPLIRSAREGVLAFSRAFTRIPPS